MLFCFMKSETSKLDKRFHLVLLTFDELDASNLCLKYILWQSLVLGEPTFQRLGCSELRYISVSYLLMYQKAL